MPIRIALVVCALGTFAAVTPAVAGDPYAGFGPSGTGTPPVNADLANAPSPQPPDNDQTLPWLQQGQSPQNTYGAAWDRQGAASGGYDMDDEGGH